MAQIGTFTRDENGAYAGTIKTLTSTSRPPSSLAPATTTRRPTIASPPTVSSSAPAGAGPLARQAPSISRSSSTIRPSTRRSTPPSSRRQGRAQAHLVAMTNHGRSAHSGAPAFPIGIMRSGERRDRRKAAHHKAGTSHNPLSASSVLSANQRTET
jgi:hypothetical protein